MVVPNSYKKMNQRGLLEHRIQEKQGQASMIYKIRSIAISISLQSAGFWTVQLVSQEVH